MSFGTRKSDRPLAGVVFDLGGTLIYPTRGDEACAGYLEAWLRAQGWPATVGPAIRESRRWLWEMSRATGRQYTMHDAVRQVAEQVGVPTPHLAFVAEAEHVFFEPELEGYRVYSDALPLLRRLRAARVRLACISNASSDWLIEQIVDRMGFRAYFDPVVSSAGFGRVKPERPKSSVWSSTAGASRPTARPWSAILWRRTFAAGAVSACVRSMPP